MAAMRYGVLGGGKRLRPFLPIETARALGLDGDGAAPRRRRDRMRARLFARSTTICRRWTTTTCAAAGRPCTSRLRRGDRDPRGRRAADARLRDPRRSGDPRRTPSVRADSASASRAPRAWRHGRRPDARHRRRDARPRRSASRTSPSLQAMKTGALLRFSVEAGAILAGAPPLSARAALVRYGEALGAAFQVADDILDAESARRGARQARRQGRRAQQGDLRFRARPQGRQAPARSPGRRGAAALDAAGLGAEGDVLRAAARFVAERRS